LTSVLTPDRVLAAVAEATNALTTGLPIKATVGPGLDHRNPAALVPGAGSRAVAAALAGNRRAHVVLAVAAPVAAALENGPLGQQDLVAAVHGPLLEALSSLDDVLGGPLQLEAAQALDADLALATAAQEVIDTGGQLVAVALLDGQEHVATLAVVLPYDLTTTGVVELPDLDDLSDTGPAPAWTATTGAGPGDPLSLLGSIEMQVTVELGRTRLTVRDLLSLSPGGVVELDRAAGSPVDLFVNGTPIAKGEVVVVDECFGVRITEIVHRDGSSSQPNG
jgi:flagellar motor switch protein FliN/FliY